MFGVSEVIYRIRRDASLMSRYVRWWLISHHGYADDFKSRKIKNYPQDMVAYCNGRKVADVALEIGVSTYMIYKKLREQRGLDIRSDSDSSA